MGKVFIRSLFVFWLLFLMSAFLTFYYFKEKENQNKNVQEMLRLTEMAKEVEDFKKELDRLYGKEEPNPDDVRAYVTLLLQNNPLSASGYASYLYNNHQRQGGK